MIKKYFGFFGFFSIIATTAGAIHGYFDIDIFFHSALLR